jgi:elongation factor Ts
MAIEITAQLIKELREKTGAGVMDCKSALKEAQGDSEQAILVLRKKGLAAAEKKAGRVTSEGLIHSYIHAGGKIGVLIEVNCETDFVARTSEFNEFVHNLAMHIAAAEPRYVSKEDVTEEDLSREREIYAEQAHETGKPEKVIEKIVDGKMSKYYSQVCLLDQPYIKDPDKTVETLIKEAIASFGENIRVNRFVRFRLGENSPSEKSC